MSAESVPSRPSHRRRAYVARPDAPGSRRAHEHQLLELLAEIRAACDDLEQGWLDRDPESTTAGQRVGQTGIELLGRARRGTRDGFPTSSGLAPAGRGGGLCRVCLGTGEHPDGGECENGPPVHGDPVGELASASMAASAADPIRRAAADMVRGVHGAAAGLRAAVGALRDAEPPPGASTRPVGCRNHALHGRWEPVYRSGLCRWCYDVALAEGDDPPGELVDAHDRGIRISKRMVDEAYRPIRDARKAARQAKRRARR